MKNIHDLISKLADVSRDRAELEKLKTKAEADLKAATAPELSIPVARKLITDARMTLDLVDAKLDLIEPGQRAADDELVQAVRAAAGKWNEKVSAIQAALEDDLVGTTFPFFEHDMRACRRWWEKGNFLQMPIFANHRAAFYDGAALKITPSWPAERMAAHFLAWVERHGSKVGVKAANIESTL